jgi:hypothetical protein
MSIQTLLQSLIPNRTPPGGVVRSVGAMPSVAPVGIMPQAAPAAQAAPELTPTAKYIQDMQALMRGGIGPLSTGQKISAVGQVLQAAGSRGATDPGAVIQGVRKQQMEKLNAQYQIAQLQQAQQQEAAQRAAIAKYTELLTDNERAALEGLPLDKRAEKISEIAFREKRVQEIKRDADGKTRYIYSNGTDQVANWSLPANTKYVDLGDKLVLINEDNGKPVLDENGKEQTLKVNMSPAAAANYGLAVKRENRVAANVGGSGGPPALPQPTVKIVDGKTTYVQWDKKRQKYVPFKQAGLTPPSKGDLSLSGVSADVQGLLARGFNVE